MQEKQTNRKQIRLRWGNSNSYSSWWECNDVSFRYKVVSIQVVSRIQTQAVKLHKNFVHFKYSLWGNKKKHFGWISSFFTSSTWNYLHLDWINLNRKDTYITPLNKGDLGYELTIPESFSAATKIILDSVSVHT